MTAIPCHRRSFGVRHAARLCLWPGFGRERERERESVCVCVCEVLHPFQPPRAEFSQGVLRWATVESSEGAFGAAPQSLTEVSHVLSREKRREEEGREGGRGRDLWVCVGLGSGRVGRGIALGLGYVAFAGHSHQ